MIFRAPCAQVAGLAVLLVSAAAVAVAGQPPQKGPLEPVKWSVALEPASGRVVAGGTFAALVTARIDEGWHVYAPDEANRGPRPVEIAVLKHPVLAAAGKMDAPEPERDMDEAFGQVTASYSETATFRLPVSVAASAPAGPHTLELSVSFQACDGSLCLPARAARVTATVTVHR